MVGVKDAQKGAAEVIKIDGAGGVLAGVMAAPFARSTVQGFAPELFDGDNGDTARLVFLVGQAVLGGMMAAGKIGNGGAVKAVGMGVAAEAGRGLLEQFVPSLAA